MTKILSCPQSMLGNTSCLKIRVHKIPGKTYENHKNKTIEATGENKDRSLGINNMISSIKSLQSLLYLAFMSII